MNSPLAAEAHENEYILCMAMRAQRPGAAFSMLMAHEVVQAIYLRAVVMYERQARKAAHDAGAFVEVEHVQSR